MVLFIETGPRTGTVVLPLPVLSWRGALTVTFVTAGDSKSSRTRASNPGLRNPSSFVTCSIVFAVMI